MKLLSKLILFELKLQNRSYHVIRTITYMLLLTSIVFAIIIPDQLAANHIKILSCFCGIIFTSMIIPHYLVKNDVQDGSLETLLSITNSQKILAAKFLALVFNFFASIIITTFFTSILFMPSLEQIIFLFVLMILTAIQISALVSFTNIIHAYFRGNTNLLIALILPLIIPTLIIGSLALETLKIDFLMILLGVDLVFVPIIFCLSSYLLKNLYNF